MYACITSISKLISLDLYKYDAKLVINEAMFVAGNKFTAVLLKHPYFPQVGEVNGKPHTV